AAQKGEEAHAPSPVLQKSVISAGRQARRVRGSALAECCSDRSVFQPVCAGISPLSCCRLWLSLHADRPEPRHYLRASRPVSSPSSSPLFARQSVRLPGCSALSLQPALFSGR